MATWKHSDEAVKKRYQDELLVHGWISKEYSRYLVPSPIFDLFVQFYFVYIDITMAVNTTIMAIEDVFEGRKTNYDKYAIERLYKRDGIGAYELSHMTEAKYSTILNNELPSFSRSQSIKLHRAIKAILGVHPVFRAEIDIGLAIIYLVNEDNVMLPRSDIQIKPDVIMAEFKHFTARELIDIGIKAFIKQLQQSHSQVKLGHGAKVWRSIKAYIEDPNVVVPEGVIKSN